MAKVGYGPKDFDPSDYQAAVRRLCSFLETLERVANDYKDHETELGLDCAMWQYLSREVPEVLQAAYMVAEVGPPDFPVLPFVTKLVFQLDEMQKAREDIICGLLPDELGVVPKWPMMDATRHLLGAWAAIVDAYPEFRGPLKLLELRSKHHPEAAPESERPAARRKLGRKTKDLPRAVSDALLKRWNQRGENAQKREVWAAEAAKWLKDERGAVAPDGELWSREEVIRFLENAQERVRRKRR
jgi:hypothetical protein